MLTDAEIWTVILLLGVGTYLMRLSFLGAVGGRRLPGWLLRHLRYAPHAVLAGMLVPMLAPSGGQPADPMALATAGVTLAAGILSRNTTAALAAGGVMWFGARALGLG